MWPDALRGHLQDRAVSHANEGPALAVKYLLPGEQCRHSEDSLEAGGSNYLLQVIPRVGQKEHALLVGLRQ